MLWMRRSRSFSGAPAENDASQLTAPLAAVLLLLIAASPPSARWLEANLVSHVLLQIPMLIGAGFILGSRLAGRQPGLRSGNASSFVPAILLAAFCLGFWMLPRWLDAAVSDPLADFLKVASVTLLVGGPLGWAWPRMPATAKAFIGINLVAMFGVLGWLYLSAPVRLCSNYLESDQKALGSWFVGLAVALGVTGAGAAFVAAGRAAPSRH